MACITPSALSSTQATTYTTTELQRTSHQLKNHLAARSHAQSHKLQPDNNCSNNCSTTAGVPTAALSGTDRCPRSYPPVCKGPACSRFVLGERRSIPQLFQLLWPERRWAMLPASLRSRSRSRSQSRSRLSRSRSRSPKRHKAHGQEPPAPAHHAAPAAPDPYAGMSAEDAAAARREAEAAAMEAEVIARRKRVEEWRAKRLAEQQAEQAAAGGAPAEEAAASAAANGAMEVDAAEEAAPEAASGADGAAGEAGQSEGGEGNASEEGGSGAQQPKGKNKNKGWSLEDDDEDDAPHHAAAGEDEEDPLDAFMKGNATTIATEDREDARQAAMEEDNDDDVDPLDAFMSATVMPQVARSMAVATARDPDAAEAMASQAQPLIKPKVEANGMDVDGGREGSLWAVSDSKAGYLDDEKSVQIKSEPGVSEAQPSGTGAAAGSGMAVKSEAGGVANSRGGPAGTLPRIVSRGFIAPNSRLGAGRGSGAAASGPGSGIGVGIGRVMGKRPVRRGGLRAAFGSDSNSESGSDSDDDEESSESEDDAEWVKNVTAGKLSKGDKLGAVDHSKMDYPPFRRSFYTEVPELVKMSAEEVTALRKELDGIKVRGSDIPKPIKAWTQCGLSTKMLELLRKEGCTAPLPIQAQALPCIMSGRDCIGIAKTGSGKTLAFVLPMLRHVKDQPPLAQGDGPIALIMAPTRELVQQISKEIKKFAKPIGIECTAVFGGSGVANQISELKRGVEVVACTPGRMIDLLVTSNGKITNLRRVTYLVMDEADRMFDMGFEPQIMRIVNNIRPDKQTVMFSATFPRSVETLARKVLDNPVEIQVGGRSVVNSDITQIVEIRPESDRFLRLLEILGEWYERGKIIIFVQSQDKCDSLFRDLLKSGYPCLSLHGGKDQADRESTIADFKGQVCNILVATSIAARGLDVRELVLVVNFDVPNHHEDYVHRVGRTGRAGNKGTAITFIAPEEERYAPDLVKALRESGAPVPQDLHDVAESFNTKRRAGLVAAHGSGYGGSGFKFDADEDEAKKAARKAAAKEFGFEANEESESSDDEIRVTTGGAGGVSDAAAAAAAAAQSAVGAAVAAAADPVAAAAAAAARAALEQRERQMQMAMQASAQAQAAGNAIAAAGIPMPPPMPSMQAAGGSTGAPAGSSTGAPAPSVNPAVLAAQAIAARLAAGAGAAGGALLPHAAPVLPVATVSMASGAAVNPNLAAVLANIPGVQLAGAAAASMPKPPLPAAPVPSGPMDISEAAERAKKAAALAAMLGTRQGAERARAAGGAAAVLGQDAPGETRYQSELEINEFPQHARWKITHRDTFNLITETTGCALITKGVYVPPGKQPPEGERKIYLLIEGPNENSVRRAKQELKRILEETTEKVMRRDAPAGPGKYSIV